MAIKTGKGAINMGCYRGSTVVIYRTVKAIRETTSESSQARVTFAYGKIGIDGKVVRVWRVSAVLRDGREIKTQWTPLISALDMIASCYHMGIMVY